MEDIAYTEFLRLDYFVFDIFRDDTVLIAYHKNFASLGEGDVPV